DIAGPALARRRRPEKAHQYVDKVDSYLLHTPPGAQFGLITPVIPNLARECINAVRINRCAQIAGVQLALHRSEYRFQTHLVANLKDYALIGAILPQFSA